MHWLPVFFLNGSPSRKSSDRISSNGILDRNANVKILDFDCDKQ
jgi:hypothetical protein